MNPLLTIVCFIGFPLTFIVFGTVRLLSFGYLPKERDTAGHGGIGQFIGWTLAGGIATILIAVGLLVWLFI